MENIVEQKLQKKITLNNSIEMPLMGLGTYRMEDIENSITSAVKYGYRSFDTATLYNNEKEIGVALNKCIKEGLVKREELFITTKLWNDDQNDPVLALKSSLERLQMDYVDLYIIHWSLGKVENGKLVEQIPLYKTWAKMEECVTLGLTKSIGVSNFNVQLLLDLSSYAKIQPCVNQVELHPFLRQFDLVDFCKMFNIAVVAYNPLARGSCVVRNKELFEKYNLFNNSTILELCEKYKKKPAQIILNWHIHNKICSIPRSSNSMRQLENLQSFDFIMDQNDYELINGLDENIRFNKTKTKSFSAGIELFS